MARTVDTALQINTEDFARSNVPIMGVRQGGCEGVWLCVMMNACCYWCQLAIVILIKMPQLYLLRSAERCAWYDVCERTNLCTTQQAHVILPWFVHTVPVLLFLRRFISHTQGFCFSLLVSVLLSLLSPSFNVERRDNIIFLFSSLLFSLHNNPPPVQRKR